MIKGPLNPAWNLLALRLEERENSPDLSVYLKEQYGVSFDELSVYYSTMMDSLEVHSDENCFSLFTLAFEFGKLHERQENDMKNLGETND